MYEGSHQLAMTTEVPTQKERWSTRTILVLQTWALVVLSILPYVAVGLGRSTNVPLSSIVALTFIPYALRMPRLIGKFLAVVSIPLLTTLASQLTGTNTLNSQALIALPLHLVVMIGFAVAARHARQVLLQALRVCLWITVFLAVVQKYFFLDRGVILGTRVCQRGGQCSYNSNVYPASVHHFSGAVVHGGFFSSRLRCFPSVANRAPPTARLCARRRRPLYDLPIELGQWSSLNGPPARPCRIPGASKRPEDAPSDPCAHNERCSRPVGV
jgi:hypothetical protein